MIMVASLRAIMHRLLGLVGSKTADSRLDEEIQTLDVLITVNLRRGMTEQQATLAARKSFGGVLRTKDAYRDDRRVTLVEGFRHRARHARLTASQGGSSHSQSTNALARPANSGKISSDACTISSVTGSTLVGCPASLRVVRS